MLNRIKTVIRAVRKAFDVDPSLRHTDEQRKLNRYLSQATDRYHLEQLEREYMKDHKTAWR
jgi:hypothetical protein